MTSALPTPAVIMLLTALTEYCKFGILWIGVGTGMNPAREASRAKVVFFKDGSSVPALEFMYELKKQDGEAFENGVARVKLLKEFGHELRRPAADFLEDGIHELRWKKTKVQYRLLYFFHKREFIVLAHGIQKEGDRVDKQDLKRAKDRRDKYLLNPKAHTLEQEIEG